MAGQIPGIVVRHLTKNEDARGWLTEVYREDELPQDFTPAMGYISFTHPGVARGPHAHRDQTDGFAFISGKFRLYLWENRDGYGDASVQFDVGEENPVFVVVPPGVVHAYKNVGDRYAFVLNFPNRLYAGWGKKEPVDEIRYENETNSRFVI